jgi:phosphoserine aminotransferase
MCGLNIAYMLEQGGIPAMAAKCKERSELLYNYIDGSDGYYVNKVESRYRSRLNIPFRVCNNEELEGKFIKEAAAKNLIELKGHRSVGGCRASLYNAMPVEGVVALIEFMKEFRDANPV